MSSVQVQRQQKQVATYVVVDGCKGDRVVVMHSYDLVLEDL